MADADGDGLAGLAASADTIIQRRIIANHRDFGERGWAVTNQAGTFDGRNNLPILNQIGLSTLEDELARGDVDRATTKIGGINAALQAGDKTKTPGMLQKLEQKTPTEPDAEIASALGNLLGSDKGFTKSSAARALEKWATADQVELLAAQLDEKDVFVAPPCMKALGRLKASQYAHQIAAKLGEISLRASAKEALVLMGSVAEEAVIPMIENPDQFTRGEVCEVLGAIGTESSLPALRYRAEKDESFLVKSKAKAAMEKIAKKTGEK